MKRTQHVVGVHTCCAGVDRPLRSQRHAQDLGNHHVCCEQVKHKLVTEQKSMYIYKDCPSKRAPWRMWAWARVWVPWVESIFVVPQQRVALTIPIYRSNLLSLGSIPHAPNFNVGVWWFVFVLKSAWAHASAQHWNWGCGGDCRLRLH